MSSTTRGLHISKRSRHRAFVNPAGFGNAVTNPLIEPILGKPRGSLVNPRCDWIVIRVDAEWQRKQRVASNQAALAGRSFVRRRVGVGK